MPATRAADGGTLAGTDAAVLVAGILMEIGLGLYGQRWNQSGGSNGGCAKNVGSA